MQMKQPAWLKQVKWQEMSPWGAMLGVMAITAFVLHSQGRLWRCACGHVYLWTSEAWGSNTSQHLFDPYSFTHILHGVMFCGLLALIFPKIPIIWRLFIGVVMESVWEVIENSEFIISRYRETGALGYNGDTVINSMGDIIACGLGLMVAWRLGWRRSLALVVVIEATLLLLIRDSLLLNIVMLIHPIQGIKDWQAAIQ
jgi:Protein of unknown function (DUF2585)